MTARLSGASRVIAVDPARSRRDAATRFGADDAVPGDDALDELVTAETADGLGVDVAIEAVGIPETFEVCTRIVRPGGVVANIGVHGAPAVLHLEELWIKNITITTGLVDGTSIPTLLRLAGTGKIRPDLFGTHRFGLGDMLDAYDVFAHAGEHDALKVVISRES
jgi:alcohol dehydrogenase